MVVSANAHAAIISNVTKTGGNGEVPVVAPLVNGVEAYTDRTHLLVDIPTEFEDDAELIQVSNSDNESTPLQYDVSLNNLTVLYVGLDDRLTSQPLSWMSDPTMTGLPTAFFDTGRQISIDEDADGSINQTFSLWATIAPAGTYSLFDQDDGGSRNMYVVFSDNKLVIPEPAALSLLSVGLIGFVTCAARRR